MSSPTSTSAGGAGTPQPARQPTSPAAPRPTQAPTQQPSPLPRPTQQPSQRPSFESGGSRPGPGAGLPLTHHEIMRVVAPFSARGYRVDLAASDRDARRIVFRSEMLPMSNGERATVRRALALHLPARRPPRLVRTLVADDGRRAEVVAEGADPGEMLAAVDDVAVEHQLFTLHGAPVACSYRIDWPEAGATAGARQAGDSRRGGRGRRGGRSSSGGEARLERAQAKLGPITLVLLDSGEAGTPLQVELHTDAGWRLEACDDLLAVAGPRWRPLKRDRDGYWVGSLRSVAREPARSADAKVMLGRAIVHLEQTLARPPAEFHARHRAARWRVAGRRLMPLLTGCLALGAFFTVALILPKTRLMHMVLSQVPIVVLVVMSLQRDPQKLEMPPLPRALQQSDWCRPSGTDTPSPRR